MWCDGCRRWLSGVTGNLSKNLSSSVCCFPCGGITFYKYFLWIFRLYQLISEMRKLNIFNRKLIKTGMLYCENFPQFRFSSCAKLFCFLAFPNSANLLLETLSNRTSNFLLVKMKIQFSSIPVSIRLKWKTETLIVQLLLVGLETFFLNRLESQVLTCICLLH